MEVFRNLCSHSLTFKRTKQIFYVLGIVFFSVLGGLSMAHGQSVYISRLGIFDDSLPSGEPSFDVSIDTVQGTCSSGAEGIPEPFKDTYVGITIRNSATSTLRLQRVQYEIPRASGRKTYTSPRLGFSGALEIAPDSEKTIYAPILSQQNGVKKLPGSKIDMSKLQGFRTVTFRVSAYIANRSATLSGATTLSFGNFNRCE